jgi:hypothetical protein
MARKRPRKALFTFDRGRVAARVIQLFNDDLDDRSGERDKQIQRYAKFRMWTEGKDWPWPNASDIALPDMMEKSLRVQDTLHNAVMSTRPPINAAAVRGTKTDHEEAIDKLIDYQVFVEQAGETKVGDLADAFVNDPAATIFVPWVKEMREAVETKTFDPLPDELEPEEYFDGLIRQEFAGERGTPDGRTDGWDWKVGEERVRFFTRDDDGIEMLREREAVVYDGPCLIVKDYDDVLYPVRSANLQIPGPSNPGGAPHVILRFSDITVDEIVRNQKSGYYDLMTTEEVKELAGHIRSDSDEESKEQKDVLQGVQENTPADARTDDGNTEPEPAPQRSLTLLLCFDMHDVDGDGKAEDVVWWVLLEPKILVRAKLLTEVFPFGRPRRPLEGGSFLPVKGRYAGISLLEMLEGVHDAVKTTYDQMVDAGTITNAPFFFYRLTSSMRPEVLQLSPGEGYPVGDPQRDVYFPQLNNNAQAYGINLITLLGSMNERVSVIGDLQFGRVPPGRSAALRTTGNMALLTGQGEARPERILRRFFNILRGVWSLIHDLNGKFLPDEKAVRVMGALPAGKDPYVTVKKADLEGGYEFDFKANVLNTSRFQLQQSLGTLLNVMLTELAISMGITTPDTAYRLLRDFARSQGVDAAERGYMIAPVPGADKPRLMAEEAIADILEGRIPDGLPAEPGGAAEHLQKLVAFEQSEQYGIFGEEHVEIFRVYLQQMGEAAQAEQRLAERKQAAMRFQSGQQGTTPDNGSGQAQTPEGPPQVQPNELLDETLPSNRPQEQ